ncbi:transglycosylase family protein [Streptomyces parvulus]|uniref:LysM peptidoglycan-binding domain-containing protein n=1 Tax=Streptomyces parvulus TaxID=146923 RepID=UPI0036F07274
MLSGNGRHRRPRQAPALVVAAGVTGSAIAIPLLGATGAHAAGANWDQVAECETGGAWSQNVGNGYYGGLQLPQEAWERYGGLEYAASADQASRSQQIRIAEKLYADQGIAAWPTCGLLAGLGNPPGATAPTGDGASEGAQAPGTSDTPDSAGSSAGSKSPEPSGSPKASDSPESPETSGSPESSDASSPSGAEKETEPTPDASASSPSSSSPSSGSPSSDASSDGKDQSAKPDTSPDSDPRATGEPDAADRSSGSGKHRGDSADEGGRWKGLTDSTSGRHASRDGGSRDADDGSYMVRSGDSLWAIADSLGVDGGWRALYSGNEGVVGQDPDLILPGQTLTVTGESGEK